MIECRHCREVFHQPLEKIGARCRVCRMPLFEKDRQRPPVVDLGGCAVHKENSAVAKCQRCGTMMCALCRTRWDGEAICAACLDRSFANGDVNPRLVQRQNRQANTSVVLACLGWSVLLLSVWPMSALFHGYADRSPATFALMLFFASFFLALFAIGNGAACLLTGGKRLTFATCGLSLASLHLGLCLGLMFINVWRH